MHTKIKNNIFPLAGSSTPLKLGYPQLGEHRSQWPKHDDKKIKNGVVQYDRKLCSVVDPKLFIPYPDPALNYQSSGSGQTFRIHADPDSDPQH